jgi:hypothetical protein
MKKKKEERGNIKERFYFKDQNKGKTKGVYVNPARGKIYIFLWGGGGMVLRPVCTPRRVYFLFFIQIQ